MEKPELTPKQYKDVVDIVDVLADEGFDGVINYDNPENYPEPFRTAYINLNKAWSDFKRSLDFIIPDDHPVRSEEEYQWVLDDEELE